MAHDLQVRETPEGVVIEVRVSPGSSRDRILGVHAGGLKVAVSAAPEKGKANRAVVALLAASLGIRARDVAIVGGAASRLKKALVRGLAAATLRDRIAGCL